MARRRAMLRGLAGEQLFEIEYGLKEMFQGNIIGFIIGFLMAMQVATPNMWILGILFVFALALAVIDALRIPSGISGRKSMVAFKEAEVEYGLKEFLLGILVGFLLGLIAAKMVV